MWRWYRSWVTDCDSFCLCVLRSADGLNSSICHHCTDHPCKRPRKWPSAYCVASDIDLSARWLQTISCDLNQTYSCSLFMFKAAGIFFVFTDWEEEDDFRATWGESFYLCLMSKFKILLKTFRDLYGQECDYIRRLLCSYSLSPAGLCGPLIQACWLFLTSDLQPKLWLLNCEDILSKNHQLRLAFI